MSAKPINEKMGPTDTESVDSYLNEVTSVRNELVNMALLVTAILVIPGIAASVYRAVNIGWQNTMFLHIFVGLITLGTAIFQRFLSFRFRAIVILSALFMAGTAGLFTYGLIGSGITFLTTLIILLSILFGVRSGFWGLIVSIIIIAGVGFGVIKGVISLNFDIAAYAIAPSSWISKTIGFSLFMTIIVICLGRFYGSLIHSIKIMNERTMELQSINTRLGEEIAERKLVEKTLGESESKFRELFDLSPQPVALTEVETGRFIDVNEKFCELTHYSKEELIGKQTTTLLVSPEDREKLIRQLLELGSVQGLEMDQRKKDGSILNTLVFNRLVQLAGKTCILTIWTNITELKLLEGQLQQALKMESIGRLAGGIAHDFNNILGIILGNAELAMDDVPADHPARHNLEEIRIACLRARDIVKQILTFSRQSKQEKKPVRIDQILEESIHLLRSSIPTTIDIHLNISSQKNLILADPTQIHQVILNLCTNAAYAMRENGGILDLALENIELNEKIASKFPDLNMGEYIQITVRDTGPGIDPEVIDRIFDPYFTTKGVGEGSGMGLAVAHGIVKNHGGEISVQSEMGIGTVFSILLPSINVQIETSFEVSIQVAHGDERILLVDDEMALIETFQPSLERLGYRVTSKTSSLDALESFKAGPNDYDLVITDMTMPQITGDDLAKNLIRIRPDIPIILCTGYNEMIDKNKAKKMGIRAFVIKPLAINEIAKIIREVLDQEKEQ